ncbi:hypothetical protein [Streptomyces silvensis]|uniref:hypothetical protein n=1 Tax=Streptomyces silvensis TaxID=1765722 RepID=UPI0007C7041E|nr:hypothetical protein [Streptomyces silvensis]
MSQPSPAADPARRTLRTVAQTLVALITALPLLADEPAVRAVPGVAAAVAVAGLLSRLMAVPAVDRVLPPWLRTGTAGSPAAPETPRATRADTTAPTEEPRP